MGIYAHSNATKNIDADTPPQQVPLEKEERAHKKEDSGEVPRKTAAGGRAATTSSFMQLAHRCRTDGRVIVNLISLRPPLDSRPLCVRRCVHGIGQSHKRRGADCTLVSWDGKRGR